MIPSAMPCRANAVKTPSASGVRAIAAILGVGVLTALAGCASTAGIAPKAETIAPASVGLESTTPSAPVDAHWWRTFGDPNLDRLVDRALAGNPSLKAAQARIDRAGALVAGAQAAAGPQVNGGLDVTRQKFSANSIYPPPLGGSTRTLGTLQASASWELDFFGRNRAAIAAAAGAERAARAEVEAARIVLASNVVTTYVQLGRLQAQRDVAVSTLKTREDILGLIRQRVQGGIDTNVELRQGEGALPEIRQQVEQLDEQIALTRHALAALTAQPPGALDTLRAPLDAVQLVPVPASIPADLLGRRADVAAARARIEAAAGERDVAKAQFYPNVNLSAFVGFASIGLSQLIRAGSEQYGVGPAITLPIFDSGRLRANLRVKTADVDAAVESYNDAVVEAVHQVADRLTSIRSVERQQAEQAAAQASAEAAFDLATQRYRAGLDTYLTVLNAETSLLAQRRQATDLRARALEQQVGLIRALGGGYSEAVATADAGQP